MNWYYYQALSQGRLGQWLAEQEEEQEEQEAINEAEMRHSARERYDAAPETSSEDDVELAQDERRMPGELGSAEPGVSGVILAVDQRDGAVARGHETREKRVDGLARAGDGVVGLLDVEVESIADDLPNRERDNSTRGGKENCAHKRIGSVVAEHTRGLLPLIAGRERLGRVVGQTVEKSEQRGDVGGRDVAERVAGIVGHEAVDMIPLLVELLARKRGEGGGVVDIVGPVGKLGDGTSAERRQLIEAILGHGREAQGHAAGFAVAAQQSDTVGQRHQSDREREGGQRRVVLRGAAHKKRVGHECAAIAEIVDPHVEPADGEVTGTGARQRRQTRHGGDVAVGEFSESQAAVIAGRNGDDVGKAPRGAPGVSGRHGCHSQNAIYHSCLKNNPAHLRVRDTPGVSFGEGCRKGQAHGGPPRRRSWRCPSQRSRTRGVSEPRGGCRRSLSAAAR